MKKFIYSLIFVITLIPSVSFATITVDPESPQEIGVNVGIICSVGDNWYLYFDGDLVDYASCPNTITSPITVGTYMLGECDSTVTDSLCGTGDLGTGGDFQGDTGYIGETTYEWTVPADEPPVPILSPVIEWFIVFFGLFIVFVTITGFVLYIGKKLL